MDNDVQTPSAGEKDRGSKGKAEFSLFFLSDKNLNKFNMQESNVMNQVMKQSMSHKIFVKWTDAYLVNADNLVMNDETSSNSENIITNYPLRNAESIQYTFASCTQEENVSYAAKRVFEELISKDQDPRVNLIILTCSSGLNIAKNLFAMIDKSLSTKSYCLWGGETFGITNAEYKEDGKIDYQKPIFMGIRILNSSMKSWSLIVDFRQLEEKLIEFKKHVQLKRCSLGFVSGRSAVIRQELYLNSTLELGSSRTVESSEIMGLITAAFPHTTFFGGFNLNLNLIYGFNSLGGDDGIVTNKLAVSLMIITHD